MQNRLGEALERIGALEAAIEAYDRAVAVRPGFAKAFNNLILVLVKAGRGREALERARARVAAAPGDPERLFTLGLAQTEQDVDAAIATFRRVLAHGARARPGALQPRDAVEADRSAAGRDRRAERGRSPSIRGPKPLSRWAAFTIRMATSRERSAALHAAIAAEPRHADAHALLGAVRKSQRRYPEAVDALRRAIALRPDLWSARATLATVMQLAGQEAAARQESAESERLRRQAALEREAVVWTAVGIASLDAGNPAAAVERFRRALAIFELYAPAHYQLGRALQRLGQTEAVARGVRTSQAAEPQPRRPADIR